LLNDARGRTETLDRQSREKAASLKHDAAHKHTEIIAALSQEKTTLEKTIDELRTFARGYRAGLTTYLASQIRELASGVWHRDPHRHWFGRGVDVEMRGSEMD
jgi:hypothetical protein